MTLTTDLIHDVIDYLVTTASANATLQAFTPPVPVYDSTNFLVGEQATQPQWLVIGYDAVSGSETAGTATSKWPFLGQSGAYREETGRIPCSAQSWSGDTVTANRALCKGIVGAVENMLRGYPASGGPGDSSMAGLVQWAQVDSFSWTQKADETGNGAACVFTVSYLARLAPN